MLHLVIPQIPWKLEGPDKLCWNHPASCPPAVWETWVQSLGWEDPLEKGTATLSSTVAWRILWTVKSMGSQRVRHDWATFTSAHFTSPSCPHSVCYRADTLAQCFSMKESPTSLFCLSFSFNKKISPREQAALYLSKVNMLTVSLEWTKITYKFTAGNIPMVLASHR